MNQNPATGWFPPQRLNSALHAGVAESTLSAAMSRINRSAFLHELYKRAHSIPRAADAIGVTDKTFGKWLKYTEDRLQHLSVDFDAWQRAAAQFDIALELFEPPTTLWDEHRSYAENLSMAPPPFPHVGVLRDLGAPLLGRKLLSCFGAGSGVTSVDGARTEFLFHSGCATVTSKTVRSRAYPPEPGTTFLYCASDTPEFDPDLPPPVVLVGDVSEGFSPRHGSVSYFRLPCEAPEQLRIEIRRANDAAAENQLFILSIIGGSDRGDEQEIINEFVATVELGLTCHVTAFELNFGCPTEPGAFALHTTPGLPQRIADAVRRAAGDAIVLLKLPYLDHASLERIVVDTAAYVDGYSAINAVAVHAERSSGPRGRVPAFGGYAGLAGRPILSYGLRCARELVQIREHHKLTHKAIIGIGGVTEPRDVLRYLDEGVDHVEAVTAFHADPLFGVKVHQALTENARRDARSQDSDLEEVWHNLGVAVRAVNADAGDPRLVARHATQLYTEIQDSYARMGHAPRRARVRSVAELTRELQYRVRSSRSPQ